MDGAGGELDRSAGAGAAGAARPNSRPTAVTGTETLVLSQPRSPPNAGPRSHSAA